jgi:aspartyl protease family protein
MIFAAWVLGLALLTVLFSDVLDRQQNPNRSVQAVVGAGGVREVVLKRNRSGHYVAPGAINGHPVTFLIDTGATDVAIPAGVAERIGLQPGLPSVSRTAAGDVPTWSTVLRSVELGGIKLHTLRATILPDMTGDQVLLGMSYLKRLELEQRGDSLTLRLP